MSPVNACYFLGQRCSVWLSCTDPPSALRRTSYMTAQCCKSGSCFSKKNTLGSEHRGNIPFLLSKWPSASPGIFRHVVSSLQLHSRLPFPSLTQAMFLLPCSGEISGYWENLPQGSFPFLLSIRCIFLGIHPFSTLQSLR